MVVPNGDVGIPIRGAERYQGGYVLLDGTRPEPLTAFHAGEEGDAR